MGVVPAYQTSSTAQYRELGEEAKANARSSVLALEESALRTDIRLTRRCHLHTAINDAGHIRRLVDQLDRIKRWSRDRTSLERVIEGNLLIFTVEGDYVAFKLEPPCAK